MRMEVKTLPIQEVKANGLKFDGVEGLSVAELFPRSLMAAVFHSWGRVLVLRGIEEVNKSFAKSRTLLQDLV